MADVSVRPALPEDAPAIGAIHAATFVAAVEAGTSAPFPGSVDAADFAAQWEAAITQPPSAKHRVLVALEDIRIVGFAALGPADTPVESGENPEGASATELADGAPQSEIVALEVAEEFRRRGHGSRLLAACVDILTATGANGVQIWCVQGDDARVRFLSQAGFAPRGIRRIYDIAGRSLTENAWHAAL